MKKIGAIGICQIQGFAASLEAILPDWSVRAFSFAEVRDTNSHTQAAEVLAGCDFVFTHWAPAEWGAVSTEALRQANRNVTVLPTFAFRGFQPDMAYLIIGDRQYTCPIGPYHSLIVAAGHRLGMEAPQIELLFNRLVYKRLGYPGEMGVSWSWLKENFKNHGLAEFMDWSRLEGECFRYTLNHPKQSALGQLARAITRMIDVRHVENADQHVFDHLSYEFQWPVYPGIADSFGRGNYEFRQTTYPENPGRTLSLREMIAGSLESYRAYPAELFDDPAVVDTAKVLDTLTA